MTSTSPSPFSATTPMLDHLEEERRAADWITNVLKAAPALDPSCACIDLLATFLYKFKVFMLPPSDQHLLVSRGAMLRGYGDLLDSAAAFANSTWFAEEQAKFSHCTQGCEKDGPNSPVAEYRKEFKQIRGPEHTALQESIILIFSLLADVCNNINGNYIEAPKLEKRPGNKWPSSPSRFIPQGAPAAVTAFSAWARSAKHIIPIATLSELASIYPPVNLALAQDTTLLGLVEELFRHHLTWLQKTVSLPTLSSHHASCAIDDINMYYIVLTSRWFQGQLDTPDFVKNNAQTLTSLYHALATYRSLLDEASFYRSDVNKHSAATLGLVGLSIQHVMSGVSQPLPAYPAFQSAWETLSQWPIRLNGVVQMLLSMRGRPRCAGSSCNRTGKEANTNLNLSKCAGCQASRYCSKECQRSDWKEHKQVCKALKVSLPIALAHGSFDLATAEICSQLQDAFRQIGLKEEDFSLIESYLQKHRPKYEYN